MGQPHDYFALATPDEVGAKVFGRYERCLADPFDPRPLYANAHMHLYGDGSDAGITYGVTRQGPQGEIAAVRVNRARALALARMALIASPEVTWKAAALKSDSGAAKATQLGQNILENFWKTRGLKAQWRELIFQAVGYSCSYKFSEWDKGAGELIPGPDGADSFEGDAVSHNVAPWRVHFDPCFTSWEVVPWAFVRLRKSRWRLASQAAREWQTVLINGKPATSAKEAYDAVANAPADPYLASLQRASEDGDAVTEINFLHKPQDIIGADGSDLYFGRHVRMLSGSCVLSDKPLTGPAGDYESWPLERLSEGSYVDTPFAWTSFWDALGSQEIQDAILTSLSTIITTLGTTAIAIEKGSEEKPDLLAQGGVRTWEYPRQGKPPQAINLAVFPKEGLDFLEKMEGGQQAVMALNDVSLGRPQTSQMNAQAFAVLASMAVQQAAPMQQAAVEVLGREGRTILGLYAKHAKGERLLRLVGKQNQSLLTAQQWKGEDLLPVKDVTVEVGNPNEQTAPGRIMKLQTLAQAGVPVTMEQAEQVLATGRTEQAERATRNENLLVTEENEQMQDGIQLTVEATENHPLHFREHCAELRSFDVKANPQRANLVREHAAGHYIAQFGPGPMPPPMPGQPPPPSAMQMMMMDPMVHPRMRFMLGLRPIPPELLAMGGAPPGMPPGMAPPGPHPAPTNGPPGQKPPQPKPPPDVESQAAGVKPPDNPVNGQPLNMTHAPIQGAPPNA